MAIKKLDIPTLEDLFIWGLLSPAGGHRMCWTLNRQLDLALCRVDDVAVCRQPEAEDAYFPLYLHEGECDGIRIELIANKRRGDIYLRELRNFDYLLMVKGELDFFDRKPFSEALRRTESVHSALEIDIDKIKHRELLVLE